jgi:lysophospholipase L1-like esterase
MKKNIALLLCSLVLILTFAELVLRVLNVEEIKKPDNRPVAGWIRIPEEVWTEYHSELGWFHQKNRHAVLKKGRTLEVELTTNNWGFRGLRDYEMRRPEHTKRVMVLGDSFVFGWGVRDQEVLTAQMESQVQNLEALNLGVAGYGIDQIYISFQKLGLEFRPDYVFIGIYQEDFWRATRAFTDAGYAKPYFSVTDSEQLVLHNVPVPEPKQMRVGQFPQVVHRPWVERALWQSALYRVTKKMLARLGKDIGIIDPSLDDEWFLGRAILHELIAEIHSIDAEPVILIVPPKEWFKNTKPTSLQKSLKRFAEREHVPLIDLTPVFAEAASQTELTDYYIKDEWHWTVKGHELVANLLLSYLREQGYLSSGRSHEVA